MDFGIASVAGITVICYLAGMGMKASEKVKNEVIPVACGCAGAALGVAGMFVMPEFPAHDVINAAAIGIVSGLAATGINQAAKQLKKMGEEVIHSSPAAPAGEAGQETEELR